MRRKLVERVEYYRERRIQYHLRMAGALVVQSTAPVQTTVVGANCAGSGKEGKGEQKLHSEVEVVVA